MRTTNNAVGYGNAAYFMILNKACDLSINFVIQANINRFGKPPFQGFHLIVADHDAYSYFGGKLVIRPIVGNCSQRIATETLLSPLLKRDSCLRCPSGFHFLLLFVLLTFVL